MSNLIHALAATCLTAAAVVVPFASPASATEKADTCSTADGDHSLNMSVTYSLSANGTQHIWGTIYGKISGQDTGGKSNFLSSVWQNSSTQVWSWPSADSYDDGEQYHKAITTASGAALRTQQAPTELVKMKVYFDTAGSDPSCTAQITA